MTEHELFMALSTERLELLAEIEELKREVEREKRSRNYWWEMYEKQTKVKEAPETDMPCEVTESERNLFK